MADPNLEICPNFTAVHYQVVHTAIMATNNIDNNKAVALLQGANQQNPPPLQQPPQPPPPQHPPQPPQPPPPQQQASPLPAPNQQGADKGKSKAVDFDVNHPPSSTLTRRPSQYALTKRSFFKYVEIWYFTPKGCLEASHLHHTNTDDTFGITNNNDVLTLRSVMSFLQGRNIFLHYAKQLGWPAKHLDNLALFFWNLENHPLHDMLQGDHVILHYTEHIRHQWHDKIKYKLEEEEVFNIGLMNDALMNLITLEVSMTIHNKVAHQVSLNPIPTIVHHSLPPPHAHSPFPLSFDNVTPTLPSR
ncbi:hypothetical protein JVU11DRAFT_8419 [Chiua virens]|nr:hypothetical protein JVU11DRAFT_8419 [Chiua virens]